MSNALAFFDNVINDREPHGISYHHDWFVNQIKEESDGIGVIQYENHWVDFKEYYTRKARQFYYETLSNLNESINKDKENLDFYVSQLRYFIDGFKNKKNFFSDTVGYLALDTLLSIARRYDYKLHNDDVDFNYIWLEFYSLYREITAFELTNIKSFFKQKGKVYKQEHLICILDNADIWESVSDSDFDFYYEKLVIRAYSSTCRKIENYLKTLPDKYIDRFVTDLCEKLETRYFPLKSTKSRYEKKLSEYMECFLSKKNCPLFFEDYIIRRKVKRDAIIVNAFQWNGNDEELEVLYDSLSENKIIETDLSTFKQAFSNEPLFMPLKIKWLLKAKSKLTDQKSIFYFIKQLYASRKMSSDYNFIIKTSNPDSEKLHDQICQVFIKYDGSEIDRSTIRNSSKILSNSSPNRKKIDLALQALTSK